MPVSPVVGAGPSSEVDPRPGRAWAWARAWPRSEPKPPLGRGRIDEGVIWLWGRSTVHFSLPGQCQPLTAQQCALGQIGRGNLVHEAARSRAGRCMSMHVDDDHQSDLIWRLEKQETRRVSGYRDTKADLMVEPWDAVHRAVGPLGDAKPTGDLPFEAIPTSGWTTSPAEWSTVWQSGRFPLAPPPCAQTTILLCQRGRCQQASPSISRTRAVPAVGKAENGTGRRARRPLPLLPSLHWAPQGAAS